VAVDDAGEDERLSPYRLGMLIEPVAGWATWRQNLERVAQTMPDLEPIWHDVEYQKPGGTIERLRERLPFLPEHQTSIGRAALEFRRGLGDGPYDAIITNSVVSALFSRRLRATPTLYAVDSTQEQIDEMEAYGVTEHSPLMQRLTLRLRCRLFEATMMIVATSRWAKAGMVDAYGLPEDKIVVVPFGADVTYWRPADDPAVRGASSRKVIFVGGDFRRKGGELLLDWFRQRPQDGVELHIVTRDPVEPTPGVVVHDDIGPYSPKLLELYQQSDVFVLPSLAEAFGIATVEAMGCELPVVVSDAGGTADIVDPGVNGFITKAGDGRELGSALEALLADADRRAAMGRQGRRIAEERFGLDRTARVTLDLLSDLAAAGRRPSDR
jgi:glycosyltransferase involved in cell wall biosynthesis